MARKKINLAEVKRQIGERNTDDSRPWFLVRRFLPPEFAQVKICWEDGASEMARLTEQ